MPPFAADVNAHMSTLPKGSIEHILYRYLFRNAVGRTNVKTWGAIKAHLSASGHTLSKTGFQQGILKRSRAGTIFIASHDNGPYRGYFLIDSQQDAELMRDWSSSANRA